MRRNLAVLYAVLGAGNLAAWIAALAVFRDRPVLLGTAFLAYSFGLRHAVDADHIAAIDNITRKLMQEGRRPLAAGLYFSLGHATVVALASAALALATTRFAAHVEALRDAGALVGTLLSALVLFIVAALNCAVLGALWRRLGAARGAGAREDAALDSLLAQRGLWARLFRPLFRLVTRSWHMYPLGFLFGLGFDTATEVAVLAIAAAESAKGLSFGAVMIFPALFAAGMALVDATDSVLMVGAYGWAFVDPARKLFYNFTITLASVMVAVAVGGIETLGLAVDRWGLDGPFWRLVAALNANFAGVGYAVIGFFLAAWAGSALYWRLRYAGKAAGPG
ncbi:MAG TPA: HoxN/HupN/NixA family nickel/cobalt transporter [Stellaceae bacterium]|nr:HoxN/HupN/NixA family nickel/cobalt transporter [Stellaceae bacterium]